MRNLLLPSSLLLSSALLSQILTTGAVAVPSDWQTPAEESLAARRVRAELAQRRSPEAPEGYEALGLVELAQGNPARAFRAFTSLVELSPKDPARLLRAGYLALLVQRPAQASEFFRRSRKERPDLPGSSRGLALSLWAQGRHREALEVLAEALGRRYPARLGPQKRLFREQARTTLEAWLRTGLAPEEEAQAWAARLGPRRGQEPHLQVALEWESEGDDADLWVAPPRGTICSYQNPQTETGLELLADLSQGLGPEVIQLHGDAELPERLSLGVSDTRPGGRSRLRGVVVALRHRGGTLPHLEIFPFTLETPGDRSLPRPVHWLADLERR